MRKEGDFQSRGQKKCPQRMFQNKTRKMSVWSANWEMGGSKCLNGLTDYLFVDQ